MSRFFRAVLSVRTLVVLLSLSQAVVLAGMWFTGRVSHWDVLCLVVVMASLGVIAWTHAQPAAGWRDSSKLWRDLYYQQIETGVTVVPEEKKG